MNKSKKNLLQWLGLLGVISFLSYFFAVVLSPLAYPGYDWKSQAVSDLSAATAPSLALWNQLSSLHGLCGIVCLMAVCVAVQGKLGKLTRIGIYTFTAMNWISGIGYAMFPLSDSGFAGTFQDVMHMVVTIAVVLLSVISLVLIIIDSFRKMRFVSLAVWASVALAAMLIGGIGVNVVPTAYFGMIQRFSIFAAVGFTAVLGIYLFSGKLERR